MVKLLVGNRRKEIYKLGIINIGKKREYSENKSSRYASHNNEKQILVE